MTLRRVVGTIAIAAAVFVLVLVLTFPTDAIVRWALARAMPAGGRGVVFERARLRPWGLRLEGVDLRDPNGSVVVHADWLTLRPSLAGLVRDDHTGRPWHARAAACAGTIEALADRDATGNIATVSWADVDLGRCPALSVVATGVSGLAAGHARVTAAGVEGESELRAVTWTGVLPGVPVLRADAVSSHWTLAGGRLVLDGLALRGPDLEARGGGTLTLGGQTQLDLVLTLAPGPQAPLPLRTIIGQLPGGVAGSDERRVAVTGPPAAPQVVAAP